MPPADPAGSGTTVVVAGWTGTENLGDELLLRALLAMLETRGVGATVVSRDPESTRAMHRVDAIGLGDVRGLVRSLRSSAGLVVGPGGIIQDETSPFSLPWHLARVLEARGLRRPVVGVGVGAGPLDRRGSRALTGRLLRHCAAIAVRDRASADLLARCGVDDVLVGCDLVLGLEAPTAASQDRIVACLRPHRPGGHRRPLQHLPDSELDPERIASTAAALDQLSGTTGLPVHLVAMEQGRDDRYHDMVADRMSASVTAAVPGIDDVLDEVARSRLVVAMRFHAGIAALLAARPMVLLGYAPKVRGLAAEIGPGAALVADDPSGYAGIPAAAATVLGADVDLTATRERLRKGLTAHDQALDRLSS
jgi:polysaccharide pyruvyl transferase CsaB